MSAPFYVAAVVAVVATLFVIVSASAIFALLYFIVSLLAVAVIFYLVGAPFVAALEVIVYAGAIMVLFVFVRMMVNLGSDSLAQQRAQLRGTAFVGPVVLATVLGGEVLYTLLRTAPAGEPATRISPERVGQTLFGAYFIGVELASMLLLAGLLGAVHLTRSGRP